MDANFSSELTINRSILYSWVCEGSTAITSWKYHAFIYGRLMKALVKSKQCSQMISRHLAFVAFANVVRCNHKMKYRCWVCKYTLNWDIKFIVLTLSSQIPVENHTTSVVLNNKSTIKNWYNFLLNSVCRGTAETVAGEP